MDPKWYRENRLYLNGFSNICDLLKLAEILKYIILIQLLLHSSAAQDFSKKENSYKYSRDGNASNEIRKQCDVNICLNGGTCYVIRSNSSPFKCECAFGCSGTICERCDTDTVANACSSGPCLQGGTCIPVEGNSHRCICPAGRAGPACELQVGINPCRDIICEHGQRCQSNGPITLCVPIEPSEPLNAGALPIMVQSQMEVSREGLQNRSTAISICDERPCYNNGRCFASPVSPGYACQCPPEWKGERCERDVRECATYPCLNQATCVEKAGGFSCICSEGFYGDLCAEELNECSSSPCLNGGLCTDLVNSFMCQCAPHWTGEKCEMEMNACNPNPCMNNAACTTVAPSQFYNCTCLPGFSGVMCEIDIDDCIGVKCAGAGQICVDGIQTHRCLCPDGWTGPGCKENVDECKFRRNLCKNGATCVDTPGNFTCACQTGYTGRYCENDIDECILYRPCQYGICQNSDGAYSCYCRPGFIGDNCTQNYDECSSNPCQNDGVCVDSDDGFVCLCTVPYSGPTCLEVQNNCNSNPCQNNATCQSNMVGYDCLCPFGYTGRHCELIQDPCISTPCGPGRCYADGRGGYGCDCIGTGYMGRLCDAPMQAQPVVIDVCADLPCKNNATCSINQRGGFDCICHPGYAGPQCEFDAPECASNPCINGGTCLEKSKPQYYNQGLIPGSFDYRSAAGYVCLCPAGRTGFACEDTLDACNPSPCMNGATCSPDNYQPYKCTCAPGFTGYDCDTDIDECVYMDSPCHTTNTIECVNTKGSYRCTCKRGWGGQSCGVQLIGCLNKPCPASNLCIPQLSVDGKHAFTCQCAPGSAGETCNMETTASFQGDSMLAIVNNPPPVSYALSIEYRTTVPGSVIISGDDILGSNVYSLYLDTVGDINLDWAHDPLKITSEETGVSFTDGEWHRIEILQTGKSVELQLLSSDRSTSISTKRTTLHYSSMAIFSSKFGGSRNQQSDPKIGKMKNYIGCIRDVIVNGAALIPEQHMSSSINVQKGCLRTEPCANKPCGRNGECLDRWFTFECRCLRPFLAPRCDQALPEGTYGYEGNRSYAEVLMTAGEKEDLKMDTNVSMIIRTTSPDGALAFIGSQANISADLDTFMSLELISGQLSARFKLGGLEPQIFIGGKKLDDGNAHLIQIFRHNNNIKGMIDSKKIFDGELNHPFAHPLLVSHVLIGGYPTLPNDNTISQPRWKRQSSNGNILLNPYAFSTSKTFKGTIQDVQVNGKHLVLFPTPGINVPQFGQSMLHGNVLRGTVSDDTCISRPCVNGASCRVTFNDYKCMCIAGWRGKRCELEDQCAKAGICPENALCHNTDVGFLCLAATTYEPSSYANLLLKNFTYSQSQFWTLSFKIRTRSQSGVILSVTSSSRNYLLIYLENGGLNIDYLLQAANSGTEQTNENITKNFVINDGHWHMLHLSFLTEKPYLQIDEQETAILLKGRPTLSLSQLFQEGSSARFGVNERIGATGRISNTQSFKGCLDGVQFGSAQEVAPVSFIEKEFFGNPSMAHFLVAASKDLQFRQCKGDSVCGSDNLIGSCLNGATCTNLWNEFQCNCSGGFIGVYCETNIDDCVNNQCVHGQCLDMVQKYSCSCQAGYSGSMCEYEINECQSSPCLNGGICKDLLNKFTCDCPEEYTGEMCEVMITVDCLSNPCQNDGSCIDWTGQDGRKTFNCSCTPGYEGKTCDLEINYCEGSPCLMESTCQSITNLQDFNCLCAPGYQGRYCDINIDECSPNPCMNAGRCMDGIATFSCVCQPGWTGLTCSNDIDECLSQPCFSAATCINTPGNYTCQCPMYHSGATCEIAGTCLTNPCIRGTCLQPTPMEHMCECPFGWSGQNCSEEINFCDSDPCRNGAQCLPVFANFSCQCDPGFIGLFCETDINECASNPCLHGVCQDNINTFTCNCNDSGFTGSNCENDINECADSTNCVHGNCINTPGSYECNCSPGYLGAHCSHMDPCFIPVAIEGTEPVKPNHGCLNGAKCVNGRVEKDSLGVESVKHNCVCLEDFEGDLCQTQKELISSASSSSPHLVYIIAPIIGVLLLLCFIACVSFIMVAKQKRANRGTYSPSRQELSGARVQMGPMMKPPPEERLI